MRDTLSQRRDKIISLLSESGELSAAELANLLAVSVQTIRTDLRDLDAAALVQRRSGFVRLRQQSENIAYSPRESISRIEKQHIALEVKNLIPDGARVALGTGTTVEQCARMLATRKNLFVTTNSIHAALALQNAQGATMELAGGTVRLRDMDMIGAASAAFFSRFQMDYAVFSCGGISKTGAVLDYNTDEVSAREAIATCARTTILVADSSKQGRDLPCRANNVWDYDVVVTGASFSQELLRHCVDSNCTVITAVTG